MKAKDLTEIQQRLDKISDLQWVKRYASEEMIQLLFDDLPKLIKFAEKHIATKKAEKA